MDHAVAYTAGQDEAYSAGQVEAHSAGLDEALAEIQLVVYPCPAVELHTLE